MKPGLRLSITLHTVLFLITAFGLPEFFAKKNDSEPTVVTVEVLPIKDFTNVAPKKKAKLPEPNKKQEVITNNQPKVALPEPSRKPDFSKPEPNPKKKPELKKVEQAKENIPALLKPKLKPQKEEKVKPVKKKKPEINEDSFASVLKSVEELKDIKPEEKDSNVDFSAVEDFLSNVNKEQKYKPGLPLSISEKDAIKQQIMRNWTVLSGAKNAKDSVVTLYIKLSRDGSVAKVEVKDSVKYSTNVFFRAITDSAIRAVHKSSPLKNLPQEKYDVKNGWRELELRFDPSEMMY